MDDKTSAERKASTRIALLWAIALLLGLGVLFVRAAIPDVTWAVALVTALFVADLAALGVLHRKSFGTRSAAFGLNSLVTILLVLGVLGVANFLAIRYPWKKDLTRDQVNTLSDQTVKAVKALTQPLKVVAFATLREKEQVKQLLDNYPAISPKFEVEHVDPSRDVSRARAAGIKMDGTLVLSLGDKTQKIESANEEKLTNTLLKLARTQTITICSVTGHGERNFSGTQGEGFDAVKKGLESQSYVVKDLALPGELAAGKIPSTCDALVIAGPTRAYLDAELRAVTEYLAEGGRAVFALDLDLRGGTDTSVQFVELLKPWGVAVKNLAVLDSQMQALGGDASIAPVMDFERTHPIVKEQLEPAFFPLARPVEVGTGLPPELSVKVIAKTAPTSWGISDLKQLATGRIAINPAKDAKGPHGVAVAVEGKLAGSKAAKASRLVVFGSSIFAANGFVRKGSNVDFFINAVSWMVEDESQISIRAKEEGAGKIDLSPRAANITALVTVFLMPLSAILVGLMVWIRRRRY